MWSQPYLLEMQSKAEDEARKEGMPYLQASEHQAAHH
jgi:hypothetical protein